MVPIMAHLAKGAFLQRPTDVVSLFLARRNGWRSVCPQKVVGVGSSPLAVPELL